MVLCHESESRYRTDSVPALEDDRNEFRRYASQADAITVNVPTASFSSNSQTRETSAVGATEHTSAKIVIPQPDTALNLFPAFQALPKMYKNGRNPRITISETSAWYAARIVSPSCIATSRNEATAPSVRIETYGVPQRGWILPKAAGSRWSTPAANGKRDTAAPRPPNWPTALPRPSNAISRARQPR